MMRASVLSAQLILLGIGPVLGQAPIPPAPLSRISAGFAIDLPALAVIEAHHQVPVTAVAERTTTGELFIGYERRLNSTIAISLSGHFMSVPMAVGYESYRLTDTIGGFVGPLGRKSMRLGDWSMFGIQCNVLYPLRNARHFDFHLLVGARMLFLPGGRISYSSGSDRLYTTVLNVVQVVGQYDEQVSYGGVGGLRVTTRSRNDNGIQLTMLGAWFPDNAFTGTLYTLRSTPQERSATYTQGQSFVGLSIAFYKSWGPPKVPMRLRKDREP